MDQHICKYKPFTDKPECWALQFLEAFTSIIKNWSNTLIAFCSHFYNYSGIKILLNYLNSEVLKTNIIAKIQDDSKYSFMALTNIFGNTLSSLYNLIKKDDKKYRTQIIELNAFPCLIKIAERFETVYDFRLKSFLCLSEIVDDKNISNLGDIKGIIKDLVDYVRICALTIESVKNCERCPLVLNDDHTTNDHQKREALIIQVNDTYFYITEFLNVLFNFSIIDGIKFVLYKNLKMKEYLEMIIREGNVTETEYSLKLLWQLCFDERVAKDVYMTKSLMKELNELAEMKEAKDNKKLLANVKGILWLLREKYETEINEIESASVNYIH